MTSTPEPAPEPVQAISADLVAVFDRLALIVSGDDTTLAVAAMDADLLLRGSLPPLAVATADVASPAPATDDPERLAIQVVEYLDRRAAASSSASAVLTDTAAVERLVAVLRTRPGNDAWAAARLERMSA